MTTSQQPAIPRLCSHGTHAAGPDHDQACGCWCHRQWGPEQRAAIEQAFEDIDTWLGFCPTDFEYHDPYTDPPRVVTLNDAWRAMQLLRELMLGDQ